MTRATVTCATWGERQTFLGTQWEVIVAAEVWGKTHGRAEHDGEEVPVWVDRPGSQQRSAGYGHR
jgi:hypothetical protein